MGGEYARKRGGGEADGDLHDSVPSQQLRDRGQGYEVGYTQCPCRNINLLKTYFDIFLSGSIVLKNIKIKIR